MTSEERRVVDVGRERGRIKGEVHILQEVETIYGMYLRHSEKLYLSETV